MTNPEMFHPMTTVERYKSLHPELLRNVQRKIDTAKPFGFDLGIYIQLQDKERDVYGGAIQCGSITPIYGASLNKLLVAGASLHHDPSNEATVAEMLRTSNNEIFKNLVQSYPKGGEGINLFGREVMKLRSNGLILSESGNYTSGSITPLDAVNMITYLQHYGGGAFDALTDTTSDSGVKKVLTGGQNIWEKTGEDYGGFMDSERGNAVVQHAVGIVENDMLTLKYAIFGSVKRPRLVTAETAAVAGKVSGVILGREVALLGAELDAVTGGKPILSLGARALQRSVSKLSGGLVD